jgi:hypothetical protein
MAEITTYGRLCGSAEAAIVLAATGYTKWYPAGLDGDAVEYKGKRFWVFNHDPIYGVTASSPDSTHIVYAPSDQEILVEDAPYNPDLPSLPDLGIPDLWKSIVDALKSIFGTILPLAVVGALVLIGLIAWSRYKK